MRAERLARWWPCAVAAVLCGGSLLLFWPGIAEYDSVDQYTQIVTHRVTDWHPPVMARLWQLLHAVVGAGQEPMFAVQLVLYWLGLGLLATALARLGRHRSAAAVLVVGLSPPFLGWMAVVLKDGQLAGSVLAALGIVAWWRLRALAMPRWAVAIVGVLLAYAILLRANSIFALAPFVVLLVSGSGQSRRGVAMTAALVVAVLAIHGPLARNVFAAAPSGVERTEPAYDLAGIAARAPDGPALGLPLGQVIEIVARQCSQPLFWDVLGTGSRCGDVWAGLMRRPVGQVYRALAVSIAHHPLAYAEHRLQHLNSTDRWLVAAHWPLGDPPENNEPNCMGLTDTGDRTLAFEQAAAAVNQTPLGWPIAWLAVAATALFVAARRPGGASRDLALALAWSAVTLEASFAVLSISSDLRYHLWSMIAAALAAVLLCGERHRSDRKPLLVGAVALTLVIVSGTVTRLLIPVPSQDYDALVD